MPSRPAKRARAAHRSSRPPGHARNLDERDVDERNLHDPTQADLLRFNGAVEYQPAIDEWLDAQPGELGLIARQWFTAMRRCGDEVRELLHDSCPVACLGDAPFAYVNVFTAHVNVGFFQGAALPDPAHLLQGAGRFMRHVKLRPGVPADSSALHALILDAYMAMKARLEHG